MIIKRVEPTSVAKVVGVVDAAFGLIIGVIVALLSMLGGSAMGGGFLGPSVGIGAIVIFPILYGLVGFIGAFIGAVIYNWAAGRVGGVQLDVE